MKDYKVAVAGTGARDIIGSTKKNVIDWLFGHIKTYDRSVAEFIRRRKTR